MNKEELYKDTDETQGIFQRYYGVSFIKFLVAIFIVVVLGIYIGILLSYGDDSLEVLYSLEEYEHYLKNEIQTLKSQNAELQKEYFELKEISAK